MPFTMSSFNPRSFEKMSQNYECLLKSGKLSDVVLVVGDTELRAHKLVLSTRSPVFADMFAHASTKEESRVEIVDVDVKVMELLVRFIYTGKVTMLDSYAADLLALANKYQLYSLKSICEKHLLSQWITSESVSDLLIFADKHQVTELAAKCMDYITKSVTQVMASEGWKNIVVKTDLVNNLFKTFNSKCLSKEIDGEEVFFIIPFNIASFDPLIYEEMSEHYESLLKNGILSDVALVVGQKELRAHKLILSARSPVFSAMFAHKSTKEAQENRVVITDVDVEVLELMVRYIYTGKIHSLDPYASELLVAAGKYQLDCLMPICEQPLLSQITTDSVSDLLILADMHQVTELTSKCIDYITKKGTEVMATDGWKKVMVRTDLLTKLCEHWYSRYSKYIYVYTNVKNDKNKLNLKKQKDIDWTVYAAKMFAAADEHQMECLKTMCVQQLLSEVITTKSLPDLLIFADLHQITELTTKCIDYIATNRTQVIASMGWKRIVLKPVLLAKVCERLNWNFAEQLLLSPITIEFVSDVLIIADLHQVAELITKCLDYITCNFTQVLQEQAWKKIAVRADLLAKLFKQFSVNFRKVCPEIENSEVYYNRIHDYDYRGKNFDWYYD